MLKGKKIIIGISGGIAAYKSLTLIRLFKKADAEVRVVTTENALWFVTRVSLESLSQNKVYYQVFAPENDYTTEHISLTDWADCFVVAPATANIIGKYANGIADDALSTSLIAFNKKVFMAPAMNVKMYEHFSNQRNLLWLHQNGVSIIEPAEGFLACGYEARGRMEEPENIFTHVDQYFASSGTLNGKTILITAGPTKEAIDPVRYIGNHSTGKMGFAIARQLAIMGAKVKLISGPVDLSTPHPSIERIDVISADEMYNATVKYFPEADAAILTAAVADFKPAKPYSAKLKKSTNTVHLNLVHNPDILKHLGEIKKQNQILVGFALETDNEEANAMDKLIKKNLDLIVLNSLKDKGAGFGGNTNKVTIINNKKDIFRFDLKSKNEVAIDIANMVKSLF